MDIVTIPMVAIVVGQRQRPADTARVADLAASIEQVGLLQPIGVVAISDIKNYRLVFGLHRVQAMQLLELGEIDAYVLPPDLYEEEYLLIELQENSARNDLTGKQRMAFAAETGRLLSVLATKVDIRIPKDAWLDEIRKRLGVHHSTLYDWWNAFCQEASLSCTPRRATEVEKQQFFDWLDAQHLHAETARLRKAEAAERAERETSLRELHEEVEEAILLYGWDVVYATVLTPVLEAHDA